jgi:hypothetical protein
VKERRRRPYWVDQPNGSTEPIWAPLGLPFGLWVLVGLKVSGPSVLQILRLEASVIARIRFWA